MSEAAFLQSIMDDPAGAATTWLVLADWLEERSDPAPRVGASTARPALAAGLDALAA